MNCPSRTDGTLENNGWNQNPPALAGDLTTREDLNGISNQRLEPASSDIEERDQNVLLDTRPQDQSDRIRGNSTTSPIALNHEIPDRSKISPSHTSEVDRSSLNHGPSCTRGLGIKLKRLAQIIIKFTKFVGPGFMVSVAYIDPGNYATDVAAGASTKFQLLFVVLMSNLFAIVLQSLAVRLGTVTGLNLAEHCRAHMPKWLNILLYILAEAAIIATDIAEVRMNKLENPPAS